ncbi:MAG: hypothetical protein WA364_22595 [Candidatus Nitrosopolaris sp.]
MGINPIPRYASTLRKMRYNSVRIAKLKIILIVKPESLFYNAYFEMDDNYN